MGNHDPYSDSSGVRASLAPKATFTTASYRLSKAFGSTAETWLGMQLSFDLAQSRDLERTIKVERIRQRDTCVGHATA